MGLNITDDNNIIESHKNGPKYFDANDNSVEDADDDNVAHQHYWRSQHQAGESQREPALSFSSSLNVSSIVNVSSIFFIYHGSNSFRVGY